MANTKTHLIETSNPCILLVSNSIRSSIRIAYFQDSTILISQSITTMIVVYSKYQICIYSYTREYHVKISDPFNIGNGMGCCSYILAD